MPFVYLLHDSGRGLYRVGRTKLLRDRLMRHYRGRWGELRFVWYIATNSAVRLERYVMAQWAAQRVEGEWFALTPEQVAAFRGVSTVEWHGRPPLTERGRNPWRPHHCPRVTNRGAKPLFIIRVGELIRPVADLPKKRDKKP